MASRFRCRHHQETKKCLSVTTTTKKQSSACDVDFVGRVRGTTSGQVDDSGRAATKTREAEARLGVGHSYQLLVRNGCETCAKHTTPPGLAGPPPGCNKHEQVMVVTQEKQDYPCFLAVGFDDLGFFPQPCILLSFMVDTCDKKVDWRNEQGEKLKGVQGASPPFW